MKVTVMKHNDLDVACWVNLQLYNRAGGISRKDDEIIYGNVSYYPIKSPIDDPEFMRVDVYTSDRISAEFKLKVYNYGGQK